MTSTVDTVLRTLSHAAHNAQRDNLPSRDVAELEHLAASALSTLDDTRAMLASRGHRSDLGSALTRKASALRRMAIMLRPAPPVTAGASLGRGNITWATDLACGLGVPLAATDPMRARLLLLNAAGGEYSVPAWSLADPCSLDYLNDGRLAVCEREGSGLAIGRPGDSHLARFGLGELLGEEHAARRPLLAVRQGAGVVVMTRDAEYRDPQWFHWEPDTGSIHRFTPDISGRATALASCDDGFLVATISPEAVWHMRMDGSAARVHSSPLTGAIVGLASLPGLVFWCSEEGIWCARMDGEILWNGTPQELTGAALCSPSAIAVEGSASPRLFVADRACGCIHMLEV